MTEPVAEPLLRMKTEVDGSDVFRLGSLIRRRVEVPPGTEVAVWPAGSRPVPVTRDQVKRALWDAYAPVAHRKVGSILDALTDSVMALLSGQTTEEESTDA